jgi:DNA-binding NarL/FixJ family response regulator
MISCNQLAEDANIMVHHRRDTVGKTVGVLLVDDQPAIRQGLRLLFQLEPGVAVVGEAGTAIEGLSLVADLRPDVVIMDVAMPGMDGITATTLLMGRHPACAVIILTMYGDPAVRARALEAGARAFVEKDRPEELRVAFRQAVASMDLATP